MHNMHLYRLQSALKYNIVPVLQLIIIWNDLI